MLGLPYLVCRILSQTKPASCASDSFACGSANWLVQIEFAATTGGITSIQFSLLFVMPSLALTDHTALASARVRLRPGNSCTHVLAL
jgi:hypothetical protein